MSIASETAGRLTEAARRVRFPRIRQISLPAAATNPCQDAEFALVVLEDGSAGPFYIWLEGSDVLGETMLSELPGTDPVRWLADAAHPSLERRSLAIGVMNAMSQSLFTTAGLSLAPASGFGGLTFTPGERVGMVGLFPSLAGRLAAAGVDLVVVEKKAALSRPDRPFEVTLDPGRLRGCAKVLITGSTLLNETLAETLAHCRTAGRVVVIGPTASAVPDVLFEAGVHAVGGSRVVDLETLLERRSRGEPWGDAVQKYLLGPEDYPGLAALVVAAAGESVPVSVPSPAGPGP